MTRRLLLGVGGLAAVVVLVLTSIFIVTRSQPGVPDHRLARVRALFTSENYLSALQALREIPQDSRDRTEVKSYLGAAYLRLHLYRAAIEEFQAAIRESPRALDPRMGLASTYIRLGDGAGALEQAGKAAEIAGDSIDALLMLGRAHWLQRNYVDAEKAGLEARKLDGGNLDAIELLFQVYLDQDDAAKFRALFDQTPDVNKAIQNLALRFFVKQEQFRRAHELHTRFERAAAERRILESQLALAREPARADLRPGLVRDLLVAGRPDEAIAVAGLYHGPVGLDLELGKAYSMAGNAAEAVRAYRRASAAGVHKLSAEIALAAITGERRHWQEAFRAERIERDYFVLAQLEDVLRSAPPIQKALVYRYAGLYDPYFYNKAAGEALAALDTAPSEFDALMTIVTAYQRLNRIDDAMRYNERAREAHPNRAEVWSRFATLALARNEPERALESMKRAVELEPGNASYLYNLAWTLDQLGRVSEAAAHYERAIRASPLSFEAMNNLALIHGNGGRPDLALKLLARAAETDPEHEGAYLNLGNHHARQRSWRAALENYDRVLALNPSNTAAAVEAARVHLETGQIDRAMERLHQALDADSHSFDAYIALSSAYQKMGNAREALAALEEAKRIRPGAPEIQEAAERLKSSIPEDVRGNRGS